MLGACYVHFSSYSNDATASGAEPSSGRIAACPIGGGQGNKKLGDPEIGASGSYGTSMLVVFFVGLGRRF